MKKLGSLALAALMVTALSVSASAANSYKAAAGTPTVDGIMDDAYKAAEVIDISNNLNGAGDGKTSGTARVLWDDKNIYVFFDVTDPILSKKANTDLFYESDSVEFFLDLAEAPGNVTKINAAQYTAPAPIDGALTTWKGRGMHWDANNGAAVHKSVVTDKGYTVEMCIPWGSNYTPKADAVIGVVFHINSDENAEEGRDGEYFAGDAAAQEKAWDTTEAYDKLTLTSEKYVAPVEDKAPATADMGLIAAIASLAASGAAVLNLKKRK